ncbi:MAG: hypothetical protein KGI33_03140 [Thaumarchaeota archaeon]|nr:hypothetical protein [Nitrososphaerota archaeon]
MSRFEEELKRDKFVCSECSRCKKIVWPPSNYCNKCLNETTWREISRKGKLVEYSYNKGECFGIVEFESQIRIVGTVKGSERPDVGQIMNLEKCDYDGDEIFIFSSTVQRNGSQNS